MKLLETAKTKQAIFANLHSSQPILVPDLRIYTESAVSYFKLRRDLACEVKLQNISQLNYISTGGSNPNLAHLDMQFIVQLLGRELEDISQWAMNGNREIYLFRRADAESCQVLNLKTAINFQIESITHTLTTQHTWM